MRYDYFMLMMAAVTISHWQFCSPNNNIDAKYAHDLALSVANLGLDLI